MGMATIGARKRFSLHSKTEDGETFYLVWAKRLNPKEHRIVADEEICDLTDEMINARIKLRR